MGKLIEGRFGGPRKPEQEKSEAPVQQPRFRYGGALDGQRLIRISETLLPKKEMIFALINGQFGLSLYNEAKRRLLMENMSNAELVARVLNASERDIKIKPAYFAALHDILRDRWSRIIDDSTIFNLVAPKENVMPVGYEDFVIVEQIAHKIRELNAKYNLFKRGERVLDLGCGRGQYTHYAAEQGSRAVGIDVDAASIAEAKEKYPELEFRVGDAAELPPDEKYNLVFSNMVVCNIETESRVRSMFARVHEALAHGGRFFVSNCDIHTDFKPGDPVKHIVTSTIHEGDKIGIQLLKGSGEYSPEWENYVWSENRLTEMLREAGFVNITIDNSMRDKGYYFLIAEK